MPPQPAPQKKPPDVQRNTAIQAGPRRTEDKRPATDSSHRRRPPYAADETSECPGSNPESKECQTHSNDSCSFRRGIPNNQPEASAQTHPQNQSRTTAEPSAAASCPRPLRSPNLILNHANLLRSTRRTPGKGIETNPLQSNRAVNPHPLSNALALTNRRSRCRSSVSTAKRRRSAARVFGQSSSAKPFTVPRKILCASITETAANATLPARRSSAQVTPSPVAEYQTAPPRKSNPQA